MAEKPDPHSRNLRLRRRSTPGVFLVTKCLHPRLRVIDSAIATEICSTLCFQARKRQIHLAAFVVMLDHWHAVLATTDGKSISGRMRILDSWIGKQTAARLSTLGCRWQKGFHDIEIRPARQFHFVCAYAEENPVRARLVNSPSDWKWSSTNPEYQTDLARPWPWNL